eukprot:CAMPEP_0180092918 /NCGR_PEP_ID=MMETSP0985-20121206/24780_1 /TAXON_ID=483367 /ORGANISM="non described non described, Strain CCMP 2436" /LENGTH=37 /DNA_ID= /DNA_START= /DNA_END= /DNA_ORIENTATION=
MGAKFRACGRTCQQLASASTRTCSRRRGAQRGVWGSL